MPLQLLHVGQFFLVVLVLPGILHVEGSLAVFNYHHLFEQFVFLIDQFFLGLLFKLFGEVLEVKLVNQLPLVDQLLLFLPSFLELLLQ